MKIDILGFLNDGLKDKKEICSKLRLGFTTINKQITELKNEKKIDQFLNLTAKGKAELKIKKVKNVIILAAGWGSRMWPATNTIPKPLVPLHGTPMIEITIKTLIKAGLRDITIVVGRHQQLFTYLIKKYNINIVHNQEWAERNNISSLHKVLHLLNNTLVLEGDAPIYNPNIILKYINSSLCYGAYHEGPTHEWSFVLRGNNVQKLKQGGEDCYIWKGGWYFTTQSSKLYCNWFRSNYKNPIYRDADAFLILLNLLHINKTPLRLYRIFDNDMVEIDTFQELCAFDPSHKNKYKGIK